MENFIGIIPLNIIASIYIIEPPYCLHWVQWWKGILEAIHMSHRSTSEGECTHRLLSWIPTIWEKNDHILCIWPTVTALRMIERLQRIIIWHGCATNVYWNAAHLCLHNFHACHPSFYVCHPSFYAHHCVMCWSKELGKGSSESVEYRRANHVLQCIVDGLSHRIVYILVKDWGKVLHSIGYSTYEGRLKPGTSMPHPPFTSVAYLIAPATSSSLAFWLAASGHGRAYLWSVKIDRHTVILSEIFHKLSSNDDVLVVGRVLGSQRRPNETESKIR